MAYNDVKLFSTENQRIGFDATGLPYITGGLIHEGKANSGQVKIEFPFVAKAVTIVQTASASLNIHLVTAATSTVKSQNHFVPLFNKGDNYTFQCPLQDIFVSLEGNTLPANSTVSFKVIAEMTTIKRDSRFDLAGSGISTL